MFGSQGLYSADDAPNSDNVCFRTALEEKYSDFSYDDLSTFGQNLKLSPVAFIVLRSALCLSRIAWWPCARSNAFALLCVTWNPGSSGLSHLVVLNYNMVHKCPTSGVYHNLAKTVRILHSAKSQRMHCGDVYEIVALLSSSKQTAACLSLQVDEHHEALPISAEAVVPTAGSAVFAGPLDPVAQDVLDRHLVVSKNSVLVLELSGRIMVLDVSGCVRVCGRLAWTTTTNAIPASTSLLALASSPPLQTLPDGLVRKDCCFVFIAMIEAQGSKSCLVGIDGHLRHVLLSSLLCLGSSTVASVNAYKRVCRSATPTETNLGAQACRVHCLVLSHKHRSVRGMQSECEQLQTQWTALLGPSEAVALRNTVVICHPGPKSGIHKRSREDKREAASISSGDPSEHEDESLELDDTLSRFISQARSCSNRGIRITNAIMQALRSRGAWRSGVLPTVPAGTKITVHNSGEDADAADIQHWDGLDGEFKGLETVGPRVSSTSALAWCLGRIAEPSCNEFDYSTRVLRNAKSVPMAAIRKKLQLLRPGGPQITGPSVSCGVPHINDVDVDLFEALLQVTSSACVKRNALYNAKVVFCLDDDLGSELGALDTDGDTA